MKKQILSVLFITSICLMSFSQVGIGTTTPDKSAVLDLSSTSQGFLPPRLTYAQRNNIALPIPTGLMIWCTDCGDHGEIQMFAGGSWTNIIGGATSNPPFTIELLGSDILGRNVDDYSGWSVSISADGTRVAIGSPLSDNNGDRSGHVRIFQWNGSAWTQMGSDIEGEAVGDWSGTSVSLSSDGTRVAIGAPYNDSNAGHVRIFEWNGTTWTQMGLDIDGEHGGARSGSSVSLSSDGTRVAIGSPYDKVERGQVRIYDWNGVAWIQVGSDIHGEVPYNQSGASVSLSANGMWVAVGVPKNNGNTGLVRIYRWNDSTSIWDQVGEDIAGKFENDNKGTSVSLSSDGTQVAIGAPGNGAGYVCIYNWNGTTWTQVGPDIQGEVPGDRSGTSVSLSANGTRVVIGAPNNDYKNQDSGHARLYTWNDATAIWEQVGADIDGEHRFDRTGWSVSITADGTYVAIGGPTHHFSTGQVQIFQLNQM